MQSCIHQRHASKTCNAFCLIQVQVITLSLFSVTRDNNRKPAPEVQPAETKDTSVGEQNSQWRETPSSTVVHVRSAVFMYSFIHILFIYILIYLTYNTAKVLFVCLESTHVTIIRKIDKAIIFIIRYAYFLKD